MAKTNFQIFNEGNTPERTYNDSEYSEATQRLSGVMPGMALSRMHNKMYYQWSAMCKAIADFIVSHGDDCMDNDVAGISAAIGRAIAGSVGNAITTHNAAPDAHENRFSQYLPLVGGVMTGAIVVGNCPGMRKATDREETSIYGGTTNQDGAAFGLLGVNCTAYGEEARGSFSIVAKAPSGERHTLTGLKDGRLLWDGKALTVRDEVIQLCKNAGVNLLRRSYAYAVGDIAYSKNLPSWARLECVRAGTTAASDPGGLASALAGTLVTDGGVLWVVDDVRDGTPVGSVRGSLYLPPGYVKANGATVQRADYPRLVAFVDRYNLWKAGSWGSPGGLFGRGNGSSTFVLPNWVDRMAQFSADGIGASVAAGLPNITGSYNTRDCAAKNYFGAFSYAPINDLYQFNWLSDIGSGTRIFDASKSNPIYGASNTVQPPAIKLMPIIRY